MGQCAVCLEVYDKFGNYGDFVCENCGQEMVYNEGHAIELDDEQRALLLELNIRRRAE